MVSGQLLSGRRKFDNAVWRLALEDEIMQNCENLSTGNLFF